MKAYEKVKTFCKENPIEAIVIGAFALTAVAKVIDAASAAQGRRAYAKAVDYRIHQAA